IAPSAAPAVEAARHAGALAAHAASLAAGEVLGAVEADGKAALPAAAAGARGAVADALALHTPRPRLARREAVRAADALAKGVAGVRPAVAGGAAAAVGAALLLGARGDALAVLAAAHRARLGVAA